MKNLTSLVVFLLLFFAVFLAVESMQAYLFDDYVETWKIISISLISAAVFIYPHYRNGLKPADILKYSYTCVDAPKVNWEHLYENIEKQFSPREFKTRFSAERPEIRIRRKPRVKNIGEVIIIRAKGNKVCIFTRPAYGLALFDAGECFHSRQEILSLLAAAPQQKINPNV
jgi:hypothetical protein